jgi:Flp pilus assembly protein CpaB
VQRTKNPGESALTDEVEPGKRSIRIFAKARGESIQAGNRVDVIYSKSDGDPKTEAKTLLRDILVRAVRPLPETLRRRILEKEGKTDFVPLYVTLDVPAGEAEFLLSLKEPESINFELRPSGDNKKVDDNRPPKES